MRTADSFDIPGRADLAPAVHEESTSSANSD
jgi:hypothetical protein